MKPLIHIYGDGSYVNYRAALSAFGASWTEGLTVPEDCDGLLLPGGGDIHGALGTEESRVIGAFVDTRRPILGICRGMQALNVWFGGTLYDDIAGHRIARGDMVHPTAAEGILASLLGASPVVNSNHHQAVDRPGQGLVICQQAMDGTVEGFTHRTLPVLGVQWHPERQSGKLRRPDAVDAAPVFLWLMDHAAGHYGKTNGKNCATI
ncbi:MAG: gamma-glutamyl-gamma-aminobutyrate hydrolase family protein [Oscillospiraceae bacterium]|nr:gamma-glutamyl-gamma-aminobutyrate hydrolase family protein [Oscillospiraceae bacterium]